ncbi:Protein kinase domain-containing protein [Fusarium sp. LHS14.1]|nr:Protein kinase domain-containing protein [Fusarium sp. LHS14.1]
MSAPAGQASQSLYHGLTKETKTCIITEKTYIPEHQLFEIVTVPRIKSSLRSTWSWLRLQFFNRNFETKLLQGRKLIAVLAIIGKLNERSLRFLIASALTDDDLPLCINNDVLQNSRGNKTIKFPSWEEAAVGSFLEKQWMVLAPILDLEDGRPIEVELDEKCALELSDCEERGITQYSRVFSAGIPSRKEGVEPRRVAVKHFPYSPKTYTQERDNLDKIKDVNNKHLIKNLATCDQIFCIIFPWAEHGDLKQYWEEKSDSARSLPVFIWSIEQLAGLASALRDLHGANCRHGDLKPSNIFYFEDDGGILKIADLGVSKVHSIATDQRKGETATTASTRAYEGPEAYGRTNAPRSRKYDCWSMGCVILEFVIWLLYDQRALDSFHLSRDSEFHSFYRPKKPGSTFDEQKTEWWENMERHPKVDEVIKLLHEDERVKGTALEELVNLVDSKILLIKPEMRPEATKITSELEELVERCKGGQTPWVNEVGASTEVPAIFRQEAPKTPVTTFQ